jgi:uncharacterized protein
MIMRIVRSGVLVAWLAGCSGAPTAPTTPQASASRTPAVPTAPAAAPTAPKASPAPPPVAVKRIERMVAMRDGVELHTLVLVPDSAELQPIMLDRSPYGASNDVPEAAVLGNAPWARRGLIIVLQDIRGRFKSGGTFAMMRPGRDPAVAGSVDETTDAYDTIEWLVHNVPHNNGRVGMIGSSYDGWLAAMALVEPHPAMVLAILEATPADMFFGDDFLHNGAPRRLPLFEYAALMEGGDRKTLSPFDYKGADVYGYHLGMGPPSAIDKQVFHGSRPTWNDVAHHPTYDEFWRQRNVDHRFGKATVPTLHVGGWFDVEDFYGSMTNYLALEKQDVEHRNRLLIGPWRHGDWDKRDSRQKLGAFDFGVDPNAKYGELRQSMIDHHLFGKGAIDDTEAWVFETGSNRWRAFDRFPPAARPTKLYLREAGALSFEPPTRAGFDEYVSDPAHPVPHSARPQKPFWMFTPTGLVDDYGLWRVADQRFAADRPDVAQWVTPPLEHDVTAAGAVTAHLYASTTGTDCDFIVKLIDVFPDDAGAMSGYQLMVAVEVLPARFRGGFTRAVATVPGKLERYAVDLRWLDHQFGKGHRIMVTVQSTWFPLIERNPQRLMDLFAATPADYQKATQRIAHAPRTPSHIELPVLED